MGTLLHDQPTAKFSPAKVEDAGDFEFSILLFEEEPIGPVPTRLEDCRAWGSDHAYEGVKMVRPDGMPDDIWLGCQRWYASTMREILDEEAEQAVAESFPTDEEIGRGFDSLPTARELAEELRAIDPAALLGEGPVADFLRGLLEATAKDVLDFRARTWEEFEGRQFALMASNGQIGGAL